MARVRFISYRIVAAERAAILRERAGIPYGVIRPAGRWRRAFRRVDRVLVFTWNSHVAPSEQPPELHSGFRSRTTHDIPDPGEKPEETADRGEDILSAVATTPDRRLARHQHNANDPPLVASLARPAVPSTTTYIHPSPPPSPPPAGSRLPRLNRLVSNSTADSGTYPSGAIAAAVQLQTRYRGFASRQALRRRLAHEVEVAAEARAAIAIQGLYRASKARAHMAEARRGAERLRAADVIHRYHRNHHHRRALASYARKAAGATYSSASWAHILAPSDTHSAETGTMTTRAPAEDEDNLEGQEHETGAHVTEGRNLHTGRSKRISIIDARATAMDLLASKGYRESALKCTPLGLPSGLDVPRGPDRLHVRLFVNLSHPFHSCSIRLSR